MILRPRLAVRSRCQHLQKPQQQQHQHHRILLPNRYNHRLPRRFFHYSSPRGSNEPQFPDHYATLSLSPNASGPEIKKQFYALSKSHHPDLHPNDPTASEKFVRISEAYNTLGSADKKSAYDRDYNRHHHHSSSSSAPGYAHRRGSYSSASTTTSPGGRPASGLSRRRTQFRGPPPSFYATGGWGAQGAKRSAAAENASHSHEAQGRAASGPAGPGVGPGGFSTTGAGYDEQSGEYSAAGAGEGLPHFDHRAHTQTHEELRRTRHRSRRPTAAQREEASRMEEAVHTVHGNSVVGNFFTIVLALGVMMGLAGAVASVQGAGVPAATAVAGSTATAGNGRGKKREQQQDR